MDSKNYIIRETEEYYPLSVLFKESGMEIDLTKETPPGMIKMWRLEDADTGTLIGAVTFQFRDGVPSLGSLAVKAEYRGHGYGWMLQQLVFDEARAMGFDVLWGYAKIPDYYYKLGWQKADFAASPNVAPPKCKSCERAGKSCFPAVIKRELIRQTE